ncbi:MAG: hypothetical protein Q8Q89_04890 [bacterium]|nr:hypothetical protein [bacterium]
MTTHTLTTEQLHKLVDAIGAGNDFPKHTDDPQVNYAVDCVVQLQMEENPPSPYNELAHMYVEEVEAFKKLDSSGRAS